MPYDVLERELGCLTLEQQQEVFDFIHFLLEKNKKEGAAGFRRQPGGLTGKFYMAPDFNATPPGFEEYV